MAYALAAPTDQCARCDRHAERIVGTRPLCPDHFANLIESCRMKARERIFAPKDITPDGFAAWVILLRHGINIGLITDDEAKVAWESAREFAA